MKLQKLNESFKVLAESALKEAAERNELRAALMNVVDQLMSKGAMIKEFEVGFQDVIERFYPDKCWWEVCDLNIFWDLMESRDPEETVQHILDNMKEDAVAENVIAESPEIKECPVCGRNFAESECSSTEEGLACPKCGEHLIKCDSGEFVKQEALTEADNPVETDYKAMKRAAFLRKHAQKD